jgi:AGCS family alanine or glycine:cation symporter
MDTVLSFLQNTLWGWPTLSLILSFGVFISVRLHFFQLIHCRLWFSQTLKDLFARRHGQKGASPLAALSTALAGSAGTGNIIGVAVAVSAAGPGVIFWMWATALLGMITVFGENILGAKYRIQKDGTWQGGAMYYLEKGVGSKPFALLFSIGCILSSFGMGNMVQASAISGTLKQVGVPPVITGIVLFVLIFLVISGGFRRISALAERLIPFVTGVYLFLCLCVLVFCHDQLLPSIGLILREAFSLKEAVYGTGISMLVAAREGISKGIFTNEAGLGSSVMAHASSHESDPVRQGMWGIFQVFLDTSIMCTLTGLCLIVTGAWKQNDSISMCIAAFNTVLGKSGSSFIMMATLLFAFATITSWYFYGERSLRYCSDRFPLFLYRLGFALCSFWACTHSLVRLWQLSDIFNGLMALPNLAALFLLSDKIVQETNRYLGKS